MKKFFILLVLCLLPLSSALSASRETDVTSYFSNKVLVDEKLGKLKAQEDEQKKKIDVLNAEIDALKKRLAIFGDPDEHEPEKIAKERKKLAKNIQNKRAKMLDNMLELSKISDNVAELNASIFEQYVENMRRIDEFVFSGKYLSAAPGGFSRLRAQIANVFAKGETKHSVAEMLKIGVAVLSAVFLFRLINFFRKKFDETLFPWLRFWLKNFLYLLLPVMALICSNLLFSFNFVVNDILFAVFMAVLFGTFARKKVADRSVLCVLSVLYGCHILFNSIAGDFDMQVEAASVVAACLVIVEAVFGFIAVRKYSLVRWIFVVPLLMVMAGYVAVANIVMFRGMNVINIAMIMTSVSAAVNELLKVSAKPISKYCSFTKVKILSEIAVWLVSAYSYFIVLACLIGLRKAQIMEMNRRLFFDMKVYGMDLSISHIALSVLVFFLIIGVFSFINKKVETEEIDESVKYSVTVGLRYIGFILAGLVFLTMLGVTLTSISIIIGALSVGIGFGLQNIVNNFVSGVIILFERPIKVGDWVLLADGHEGRVRNISIRTTTIETFQNAHIIVPNADILSGSFTNWTRRQPYNRLDIPISIALDADPERAREVLLEVAKDETKVLDIPPPYVIMPDWHDDCVILQLRVFLRNAADRCMVNSNLRYGIVKKFKECGIERPIPRRTIITADTAKPETKEKAEAENKDGDVP